MVKSTPSANCSSISMITCPRCGFENPASNKFCQNCGINLAVAIDPLPLETKVSIAVAIASPQQPSSPDPLIANSPTNNLDVVDELILEAIALETASEIDAEKDLTEVENSQTQETNETTEPFLEFSLGSAKIASDLAIDRANDEEHLPEQEISSPLDNSQSSTLITLLEQPANPVKMRLKSLKYAGMTDVGKLRDHNEDDFKICHQVMTSEDKDQEFIQAYRSLFVLCDGMGGHDSGEVASAMAIASITNQFQPFWSDKLPGEQKLRDIILATNQEIYDLNEQELRSELGRMGTTLAILALHNTEVAIAHVGDSRIYKITNSSIEKDDQSESNPKLEQITRDHEVANRLIDQGVDAEIAIARFDAHQLTQAIGPNANLHVSPSIQFFSICEPTLFLLCSDGLCDNDVVEQNWQTHLLPLLSPDADLQVGVKELIALGNDLNGHDNITAILINCQVEPISP
ncbi:serine/threonine phosphatase [Tumidithrix elongata RA019]|uniref:Serine/threonine phosphatase n=1 Tax=Tumidithrix elongata BACA0141 TaxID=2716417 RepID=A0AAW9Q1N5_9CYAN|nr:serine/threonine phosphatase [Tumidithrix elongata RA019]